MRLLCIENLLHRIITGNRRPAITLCIFCASVMLAHSGETNPSSVPLSTETIVENLQAANLRRADELHGYTGTRTYKIDYHGFPGGRHAEMEVEAAYMSPDKKDFHVVSQSGSKLLEKRVLLRLLESEKEALKDDNPQRIALTPENYRFSLLTTEQTPQGECYVLQVEPKRKNKFLYRGKIWVHAGDFAVTRIEAEPATNPSWWISHTEIRHEYMKIGEFWLPARNESVTHVRLGGKAVLTIEYTNYQIKTANPAAAAVWK